jgi:glycosyltransferase involved in cell wall biosynthesis
VGVNREIVQDGVNGFLAATPGEWQKKLGRLLTDSDLRARFREAGRRTIEERYSLRVTAPKLVAAFHRALGTAPVPAAVRAPLVEEAAATPRRATLDG